jgi:cob(I)alamin adenosyltransferase
MKIYTRRGDDGSTGLLGQGRVLKSAPRVEAYGSVDELNAALGVARAQDGNGWLAASLDSIQNRLFTVGAELASTTPEALGKVERIDVLQVTWLESEIDRLEADLAPLTQFIVPGGTALAAALHVARTVCRRRRAPCRGAGAERHRVARGRALSEPARRSVVRDGAVGEPSCRGRRSAVAARVARRRMKTRRSDRSGQPIVRTS